MKCTECRSVIRPVAALDIDGTLAEYHGWFGRMACGYWNKPYPVTPWRGYGEFEDYLGLSKAQYREAKMAYRQGGYKRTQPIDHHALDLVRAIRGCEAELWITTTRPWKRLDNIDPDTQWWLEVHGISYDHLLYDDDKYGVLADRVGKERVAFILEDLPEQYERAVEIYGWGVPVMISRNHNQHWRSHLSSANAVASPNVGAAVLTAVRYMDNWYERFAA